MNRVYVYHKFQRLWHWLQAATILLLIFSGLEIHLPGQVHLFGFRLAVLTHNTAAFILLANAFLGFFYYFTTGEIRQMLPLSRNLLQALLLQLRFYLSGIFSCAPHPHSKKAASRLNPLQRLTYFMVLNVMLPLQVVTGLMIWGRQQLAEPERFGSLAILASVHSLGAWLFCAFLILHLYLITTGHTPASNLKAMITGWDEQDGSEPASAEATQ